MRAPTTDSTLHPTSVPVRTLTRVASAGLLVVAIAAVGNAIAGKETPMPSDYVVDAEAPTRQFLDQRAAAHLRQLRQL